MNLILQLIREAIDMKLIIQWAITSSVLILIVLAARFFLKDRLSARLKYALWGVWSFCGCWCPSRWNCPPRFPTLCRCWPPIWPRI